MIYLRGNVWWAKFKENGKAKRASLKTSNMHEAKRRADALVKTRDARSAVKGARIAMTGAWLTPENEAYFWAAKRWSSMNPRERQAVVFSMYEGKCAYCGCVVVIPLLRDRKRLPNRAVIDHKIPMAGGGSNSIENMALACNACNIKKNDATDLGDR